jgi:hypothetical protein
MAVRGKILNFPTLALSLVHIILVAAHNDLAMKGQVVGLGLSVAAVNSLLAVRPCLA